MLPVMNYQMSVFGDYLSITPNMELTEKLTKAPGSLKLLPSIANVVHMGAPNVLDIMPGSGQPKVLLRLQLIDETQQWNAVIMPNRIDVNYTIPFGTNALSWETIANTAIELLRHMVLTCDVNFGRIAINLALLLLSNRDEQLNEFSKRLIQPFAFQNGKESSEWGVRMNTPTSFVINEGKEEQINVIHELSLNSAMSVKNDKNDERRAAIAHIDVNTTAENMTPRFDSTALDIFKAQATGIINSMLVEIERIWNDDKC